jgi:hypothetical protein
MGSARPARRFDALRALGDGPARKAFAERAPSVRFRVPSEVWSSLPRRPADLRKPKTGRRTTLTSLGFVAVRHVPGRRLRVMGGVPPLPRATSGVLTPIAASTTVPPDALRRRSVHRLPSSRPSPRVDRASFRTPRPSCRSSRRFERFSGKRSDVGGFRALVSTRMRSVHRIARGRIRAEPGASLPPRGSPPSSVLPRRPGVALWSRALPVHIRSCRRLDGTASSGLADRRGRYAPLGATGSSGVLHLATVADSFRPALGASSWFRFESRARCMRRDSR